ncbi:hypothetical protein pb186bvf_019149 [Paramecium bursaria]
MNINIYDEGSLMALSQINFYNKHTISSKNKMAKTRTGQYSQSDQTVQACLESLKQSQKKSYKPQLDIYEYGQTFLQKKQQRQEYLSQVAEKKRQSECTFQPSINPISSQFQSRLTESKRKISLLDSQTLQLEKDLVQCTFSPRILKTSMDRFDRTRPIYERNLGWKQQVIALNQERQAIIEEQQCSKIISTINPSQLDLRATHLLKRNVSAKYLRKTMPEQDGSTRETEKLLKLY